MDENKEKASEDMLQLETKSLFNFRAIYTSLVLNWSWFIFSVLGCVAVAYVYLRYTTPVYQAYAKLLIKEEQSSRRGGNNSIQNTNNLGLISYSSGIDNEMEILSSYVGTKCRARFETLCELL